MARYSKILAAVDGSPVAAKGLAEAIRLAKSQGAQLHILHVVNRFHAYDRSAGIGLGADAAASLRQDGQRILDQALAAAKKQGVSAKSVMREVRGGAAADPIVREARKLRADLIVLGTHGRRGMRRLVLGSDAEEVVRGASVPVLLVRG